MTQTYRLHPNVYLIFILLLIFTFTIMYFWGSSDIIAGIGLSTIIIVLIILSNLYVMWGKVIINDEGIIAGARLYFDFRRSLKWDEIGSIEYKRILFLKTIRLVALGSRLVKVCRTIALSTLIRNCPQLLREIIMHTYDETKVDSEVVKLAGMIPEELGNRRSTTLIRVIE